MVLTKKKNKKYELILTRRAKS